MTAQREWFEKDYYAVLGVAQNASAKDVTKAYRKLARQYHPDANPNNAAAEERFKEISAAYDVLGDETRRREYDEVRRLGPGAFGGSGNGSVRFDMGDMAGAGGLGDLLGQMFGGGRRAGGGVGPQRGSDLEASLTIDFVDAAQGITTSLHITSEAVCSTCNGSGARPGTSPVRCSHCGGRGVSDVNQGGFAFSVPCSQCGGRGVKVEHPCGTCRGTGVEMRNREVNVRVPAGIDDGSRIRIKGRGGPGRNGGPPGDLFVVCRVTPHPMFSRDGRNLLVRVPVSFTSAALGADVAVPTLEGDTVMLRLRAGTQPGSRHRVKGRGITTNKMQGDLIVTVDVVVPTSLTDQQREALLAFAQAEGTNGSHAHVKHAKEETV
ncbi:MAG: molecular chaperone DnaJ [Ilumatobacteraceae bacterium]